MEYPFKDLLPLDEVLAREGYYKDWTHIDADTFHKISELVKFIREKGYGSDTREAIAQALERVYHDAAMSGNANMEVSMARKHFKDLASRLDASDDKLTSTTTQLAQKADRSQVDTFEARIEDIIQSSDLDPNKDQEVVDARLGSPTLGSKIQEMDELSEYYAGSGVGVSSGRTLAWERGSLNLVDGSLHSSDVAIRTIDYFYGEKGNIIFLPDPRYVFSVLEYKSEDNYAGGVSDINSYTIGNQQNLLKIVIKRKEATTIHLSEIRDISGKLFFSKNEGIINHIKKEISFNRFNFILHEGEDYTWEPGVYKVENGNEYDLEGRIRAVDYLEVGKNDIITTDSSFEYYAIMYNHEFNMIDSIKDYRREDYVIENEAVKYIRPIIKHNVAGTPSPQYIEHVSSSFRVYKRTKDAFKEQSPAADRGYNVKISGVAVPNQTISSKGQNEPTLSAIKLENGVAKGYLYHGDNLGDGLYYSPSKFDDLEKIGELDFNPKNFMPIIGDDGEIIWVHAGARTTKPRIHVDDYNQSSQIETEITPISWLQSCGIDYGEDENGEFLIFGEYTGVRVGEIHLWKVRKPYNDPSNWKIVKTVTQSISHRQGTADESWHFHTVQRDPYTNNWYATSGDSDLESKWWYSTDNGESWELLVDHTTQWGSQIARVLNFAFTEDYIYWANDYGTNHSLNRVTRNEETGVIDPSTRVKLAELNKLQSTYATILTHSPAGILMLDRVDGEFSHRTDELAIEFWSFDDERLHILSKLKRLKSNPNEPFGFRGKAYTLNQGIYDTRLAIGFGDVHPNLLDIEGNNSSGRKTVLLEIF